jgi:hypothetical protein
MLSRHFTSPFFESESRDQNGDANRVLEVLDHVERFLREDAPAIR